MTPFMSMRFDEFVQDRFLRDRAKFAFLIGAGCSVEAGIPDKQGFAAIVAAERGLNLASLTDLRFHDLLEVYSSDTSVQRALIKREMRKGSPRQLHVDLAALLAVGWVNAVFTTNFDNLVDMTVRRVAPGSAVLRYARIAEDFSSAGKHLLPTPVASVAKLHGDYLLENVLTHPWQMRELLPPFRSLFRHWVANHGLVVVGYGSGDPDIEEELRKAEGDDNSLPLGLIWVLRESAEPPDWLRKIHDRRRDPWIRILRVQSAEAFFAQLRREVIRDFPDEWERLRQPLISQADRELSYLRVPGRRPGQRSYDPSAPDIYRSRIEAEGEFASFKASRVPGLLVVNRSGAGKTLFLANMCRKIKAQGGIPIWYRAVRWNAPGDLHRAIATAIGTDERGLRDKLFDLGRVVDIVNRERHVAIFIDGVNEVTSPVQLASEVDEFIALIRGAPRVKVIVSCREETFARYLFAEENYWETQKRGAEGAAPSLSLEQLSDDDYAELWAAYARKLDLASGSRSLGNFSLGTQQLIRSSPLMLRFVAETFADSEVPSHDLSSLEVFRRYLATYVRGDTPHRAFPNVAGEYPLLVEILPTLMMPTRNVFHRQVRLDELREAAERRYSVVSPGQPGSESSPYASLVSKGVLVEFDSRPAGGLLDEKHVAFYFDRLLEFVLAERLRALGCNNSSADLESVVDMGREHAALWGAAKVLVLARIEGTRAGGPFDAQVGSGAAEIEELLRGELPGVRALIIDALVTLGEENGELAHAILTALLSSSMRAARHVSVAAAVRLGASELLRAGCSSSDGDVRDRAAQGAVYLWQRDSAVGDALWRDVAARAGEELKGSTGSWPDLVRTAAQVAGSAIDRDDSVGAFIERKIPTGLAFAHIGMQSYALSRGVLAERTVISNALHSIVDENFQGVRGRALASLFKEIFRRKFLEAFRVSGQYHALENELRQLQRPGAEHDAALDLLRGWCGEPNTARPALDAFRVAASGGLLSALILRGTLVGDLRSNPDDAAYVALRLAQDGTDLAVWHGLTAAGYLLYVAAAADRRERGWYARLREECLDVQQDLWSQDRSLQTQVSGVSAPLFDLQHSYLAHLECNAPLPQLVELLASHGLATRAIERDEMQIRALSVLPRLGKTKDAMVALGRWRETSNPALLETLADVFSELLAVRPIDAEAWLIRSDNRNLQALVESRFLAGPTAQSLFRYGVYSFVALAFNPKSQRRAGELLTGILQSDQSIDLALSAIGNWLFDPWTTPFYDA